MSGSPRPYTLIAELTHRCPLRCGYCSNPVAASRRSEELDGGAWARVLGEARDLGVLQVHFTGGEPLLRSELRALVARARQLELFTNLITSGVPLDRRRLAGLRDAGLEHVQLSFQGPNAASSAVYAGADAFEQKLRVAAWTVELGMVLTLNVVLHRGNMEQIPALVRLAEALSAQRLELANVQYLGSALVHRSALLPTHCQLERAREDAARARERLLGVMDVVFVLPDYFTGRPRACMNGWGHRYIVVDPLGVVLPCHAARAIAGLEFESIRGDSLERIWQHSPAMNAFRGLDWMEEPCRSCERRETDFGGCRCQAFQLTGDARAADPACSLSRDHGIVQRARAQSEAAHAQERVVPLRARSGRQTSNPERKLSPGQDSR